MRHILYLVAGLSCAFDPLRSEAPAMPPFRVGLNGPFIGSMQSVDQQLTALRELGIGGLRHIEPDDVGWALVQTSSGAFTFTAADTLLRGSTGFGFLPTFFGTSAQNLYVPPGTAATNSWSAAVYGTATSTYLQAVVNRYKFGTHYWEIANEMNTKTTAPAGFSAADFATFLVFNRNAIRAADPQAQIVLPGELGNYGYPFENGYQWLRDVLAAGGGAGFDVFNYHDYKSWWTLPTHYDQYRGILDGAGLRNVPIIVTETAQASSILNANVNPTYASIDGQAADVWRRLCLLFGKGAQTVYWHSYWANEIDTTGFHDMGLVNPATNVKKKAWHSLKLLAQKIEGFATATIVSLGTATDDNVTGGAGTWVIRFNFADGTRRWVAWSPNGESATLTGFSGAMSVTLTTVVPATISGDGNAVTWTTSSRAVAGDTVTLTLADLPVLIEPLNTAPAITSAPTGQSAALGGTVTLTAAATGSAPLAYQWQRNGTAIAGATSGSLTLADLQPLDAGIYTLTVANAVGSVTTEPVLVGITITGKVAGSAAEVAANIMHPNGNVYDQVLLQGSAAAITADAGQITRISYVDLNDDIVQVEFSGAGTLALALDNASGPAAAVNYNQPAVAYMKGHASIVITGADDTTNVSVFSVGTVTATNAALFKPGTMYDGLADVALVAIASPGQKFGGVRTANANYFAAKGLTGLFAPGVRFSGPVYLGDINASATATPVLRVASVGTSTWITGGDLLQANGWPVQTSGLFRLEFVAGTTSHGATIAAQANKAVLQSNGVDVTAQVVVNP